MRIARTRSRLAAALVIAIAGAGCANDWALGGRPGESAYPPSSGDYYTGNYGSGSQGFNGGATELLFIAGVFGAALVIAAVAKGLHELFNS